MRNFSLLCATAAIIMPVAGYAQETTGTIRGQVTANGAGVAGAEVTIVNVPSGTTNSVTTDATGNFNAAGLRVGGPYRVSVTAQGYDAFEATVPSLTAGQPFLVPVELGGGAEEIVVTGARTIREQSQGPITTLTREEIEGVASISRDIRDIARRDPFANIDQSNSRAVEIAGNNARLNRFSVDGVQFSDDFGLNNGGLPTARGPVPFDAIEQLSVKTAPYDVEEGDFQGGAINVILRSGGNRFTGSAFYSYLDESLTGDEIRGVPVALDFKSEQYGAFLSGPIIRDRLFFAVSYERTKEGDPTDEGPTGLGFANEIPRVTQATVDQITGIVTGARYGFDPLGVFTTATENDEKYTIKLDANLSDNQRASLTYIHNTGSNQFTQNNSVTNTNPTLGFRSNGYELTEEVNSGVFQLNSTWTDNLSSELRVSYRDVNRDQIPFGGRDFAQLEICLDPTSAGSTTTCTLAAAATPTAPAVLATPRVFLGPDVSRQSNDLNTDNFSTDFRLSYQAGAHTIKFVAGYTDIDVFNLFLQRSLGDYYFDSIADLQSGRAGRLRLGGAVPSLDPNDAAAQFTSQTYTIGIQDDIDVTDELQVTIGARFDLLGSPDRPDLNPNFFNRYGFTNRETYSGRSIFQPRAGFDWKPIDRLNLSGGVGIFGGGSPDVFLSNSFSNTGLLTNQIDISRNTTAQGCNVSVGTTAAERAAFCSAALDNVNGRDFPAAVTNYLATNVASLANAPTNAIDPDFNLPSQLVATLSVNYEADLGPLGDGWLFGLSGYYAEVRHGIDYIDLRSRPIGTLPDGRPRYTDFDANFNNTNQDLLLTNDDRGRRLIGVARFQKDWDFGLGIGASYTWQDIEDVSAITSATAGSLYANNQFVDPNKAEYGTSVYQIRHSLKGNIDFNRAFFGDYNTRISIFGERRSGRPYSFTFRDPVTQRSPVFGTTGTSSRYLMYVPSGPTDPLVSYDSVATQNALNEFIDETDGLSQYRGRIVPKNTARSPMYTKVDVHVSQEIPTFVGASRIKLFADIENFLNLLDSDWGVQRQVNFPSNASLVNVQCLLAPVATGTAPGTGQVNTNTSQTCAQYRYSSFAEPSIQVQNNNRQSLYQIRVGIRFEF